MNGQNTESRPAEFDSTDSGDEFDPKGTLALILMYFGILVVFWIFIYFVEFLGNDLTVVG